MAKKMKIKPIDLTIRIDGEKYVTPDGSKFSTLLRAEQHLASIIKTKKTKQ